VHFIAHVQKEKKPETGNRKPVCHYGETYWHWAIQIELMAQICFFSRVSDNCRVNPSPFLAFVKQFSVTKHQTQTN